MTHPHRSLGDPARLEALQATGLLDSDPEASFDRLTRLVTRLLGVPVALVTLVDRDRQFFKSSRGLPEPWSTRRQTPLSHSFCQHVVADRAPLVVEDARRDPRLADNLAIPDLDVVAYAGIPLVTRSGQVLGSFCAIDSVPRRWTEAELETLSDLAAAAATEIELRLELGSRRRAEEALEQRVRERTDELGRASESLRQSEQEYRGLFESAHDALLVLDPDTEEVLDVNARACQLYGFSRGEFVGLSMRDLSSPGGDGDDPRLRRTLDAGGSFQFETVQRRRDGREMRLEVNAAVVEYRRRPAILSINRDVTERRALEEQLRQAQKMEAVGRLAGGIAHDFNNLLMSIMAQTYVLLRDADPAGPSRWSVEEIQRASERAAALTRQLLAFSRKQVLQPVVLDPGEVVEGMGGMLRRLIGEDVEFRTVREPGAGRVRADRSQLEQVILNLAVNARDAMPGGGVLTIETSRARVGETVRREGTVFPAGRYALLRVRDTGHGIDPETQARIFEPFFTTKELGKGTGLGLSTVYGIVKQSGGWIWVESAPGQGTSFDVYLPLVEDAAAEPAPASPPAPPRARGQETILLVEDDAAVRLPVRAILEASGYCVLEAEDGEAGLRAAAASPDPVDLVLCDVVMPRMGGPEMVRRLLAERPGLPALFISGYTDQAVARHGELGPGAGFLQKPVAPPELLRRVRAALDARA